VYCVGCCVLLERDNQYKRWRKAVGRCRKWTGEDDPVGNRRRYRGEERTVCVCVSVFASLVWIGGMSVSVLMSIIISPSPSPSPFSIFRQTGLIFWYGTDDRPGCGRGFSNHRHQEEITLPQPPPSHLPCHSCHSQYLWAAVFSVSMLTCHV